MEYIIAWYPTIKLIVTLMFVIGGATLIAKGHIKLGVSMIVFFGWLYFMVPVHIDGTNSKVALKHESQYQDSKYKYYAEETEQKEEKVLTFDEQLAIIDAKSATKNKKIEDSL